MVCGSSLLARTFLVGLFQINDLSVVSGSENLNQGVLISSKTLRQAYVNRSIKTWKEIVQLKLRKLGKIEETVGYHYIPGEARALKLMFASVDVNKKFVHLNICQLSVFSPSWPVSAAGHHTELVFSAAPAPLPPDLLSGHFLEQIPEAADKNQV